MGITAKEVCENALGALGWIQGWTEPDDGSPQRRIRIEDDGGAIPSKSSSWNQASMLVRVEGAPYSREPDQRFRIAITVERVT